MRADKLQDRIRIQTAVGTTHVLDDGRVVRQQAPEPVAEMAKALRERGMARHAPGAGVHAAEIPIEIYWRLTEQANGDEQELDKLLRKFLNDPDNAAFRVWKGRV